MGKKMFCLMAVLLLATALPVSVYAADSLEADEFFITSDNLVHMTGAELISMERTHLFDNLYEYCFIIKVGKGEFDKIGIHRIVKEDRSIHPPKKPIKTEHPPAWPVTITEGSIDFTVQDPQNIKAQALDTGGVQILDTL